jgi:hypothetical protein
MDRLINQAINMPGRGSMVMNGFTSYEAAPFLQQLTGAFGSRGAAGAAARDSWMTLGDRLATGSAGFDASPDGVLQSALGGVGVTPGGPMMLRSGGGRGARTMAQGLGGLHLTMPDGTQMHTDANSIPGMSTLGKGGSAPVTINGSIAVTVHVVDQKGQTVGRATTRASVHDLQNGALTLSVAPHASTASHQ